MQKEVSAALIKDYQQAIEQLPWQTHQITLLLDGINVPNILPLLYINGTTHFEVLYLNTRLQDIKEVSPCLVRLDSPTSYPVSLFLENINHEWGYFLASQSPWNEQVHHLRSLLIVEDGESQKQMLLKIADPLVMSELLTVAIREQSPALFGPFSHILAVDVFEQRLISMQRPDLSSLQQSVPLIKMPYQLTPQENAALDWVDTKRANQQIYNHMQTYFPAFLARYGDRYKSQIDSIISQAEALGYTSVKAQLYYLNIHGYLGINALQDNPQLAERIYEKNIESLKEAAQLAKQLFEEQGITA